MRKTNNIVWGDQSGLSGSDLRSWNTQRLTPTHKRVVALPAHRPHMLLTSVLVGMNLEKSLFCLLFLFLNALVANSEQEQHRVRDVAEEETELVVAAIYKVGILLLP